MNKEVAKCWKILQPVNLPAYHPQLPYHLMGLVVY